MSDGPLIRESSRFFGVVTVVVLLLGGLAGVVNSPSGGTEHASPAAHAEDHEHDDGMAHDDDGAAHAHDGGATHDDTGGDAAHDDGAAHDGGGDGHAHEGEAADGTVTAAAGPMPAGHDHGGAGPEATPPAAAPDGHAGHQDGDHAEPHEGGDHAAPHDDGGGAHAHAAGCSDDHPATKAFVKRVQFSLANLYPDVPTLVSQGYIPYFDALFPMGYPLDGNGISHWLQPYYIDDGVMLDPLRPEAVLLDQWRRPIGMMFIADPDEDAPPVYVEGGSACSPWHPHTDYPARFGWWFYRSVYERSATEGDTGLPEKTPPMMHVWAIDNPHGAYEAHRYPPASSREGPPGPMPSYFREAEPPGA